MTTDAQDRISVETNPTFWDMFIGSLGLIPYQGWTIVCHAFFPLAGAFLLMTPLIGYRLGLSEVLLALLGFCFTPIVTAVAVWSMRRRNKLAHGPFEYVFDSDGVHSSGPTFKQTIQWSAIPRVRQSKRFLFVFISPTRAFCIPLRDFADPQALARLRGLASRHTDVR